MARTNTLANYITDVCVAVKEKAGITGKVNASEIDNIIRNLQVGGGLEPNIFIQEEEPETKEGLWVKSSNIQVDNIVVDEYVYTQGTFVDKTLLPTVHGGSSYYAPAAAVVGDWLYLIGNEASTAQSQVSYKMHTKTYEVVVLNTPPVPVYGRVASVDGTDIWLMGNNDAYTTNYNPYAIYKYDTLTDTYNYITTFETDSIYYSHPDYSKYMKYGDNIYFFNLASESLNSSYPYLSLHANFKYNITTDTWTRLADYPYDGCPRLCNWFILGDKLWFCSCYNGNTTSSVSNIGQYANKFLVFDFTTETFINPNLQFASAIFNVANSLPYNPCFVFDDYVYMLRGGYSTIYKIPVSKFTLNASAVSLTGADYTTFTGFTNNGEDTSIAVGNDAVFFCGNYYSSSGQIQVLTMESKEYDNNTLVIRQGVSNTSAVLTQLFNTPLKSGRLTYPLYNAIHYTTEGGANNTLPLYYGDGTQWIKFRN